MTESDEVADSPLSEKLELSATIRDGSEDGKGDGRLGAGSAYKSTLDLYIK